MNCFIFFEEFKTSTAFMDGDPPVYKMNTGNHQNLGDGRNMLIAALRICIGFTLLCIVVLMMMLNW